MKTLKNHWFLIMIIVAMIAAVMFIFTALPVFRVATGSMEPTLPVGSFVYVAPVDADTLKPGNIIMFQQADDDHPTTHTFYGYADDGSLMTKGDANPTPDVHTPPLTQDEVLGQVMLVNPLLAPTFWLSQRGVLIFAFVVGSIFMFWMSTRVGNNDNEDEVQSEHPHDESRELNPV